MPDFQFQAFGVKYLYANNVNNYRIFLFRTSGASNQTFFTKARISAPAEQIDQTVRQYIQGISYQSIDPEFLHDFHREWTEMRQVHYELMRMQGFSHLTWVITEERKRRQQEREYELWRQMQSFSTYVPLVHPFL
jgi:hypothetical protein